MNPSDSVNASPVGFQHPLMQAFPALPQKFIVDFANGIDVARDHSRVQRERTGLFARMCDGFSGTSAQRQAEVNARLIDGVEGSLRWLTDLSHAQTFNSQALARVQDRVTELQENVACLADFSVQLRDQLKALNDRLSEATQQLQKEVARISLEQRAYRQMDQVFDKWAAGRLDALPVLSRLSVCLEELYWGDFGTLVESKGDVRLAQSLIQQIEDRAARQFREDMSRQFPSAQGRLPTSTLLTVTPMQIPDVDADMEAIGVAEYLGDWALPERQPFTYVSTQRPQEWPLTMPRLLSAPRAAAALVHERFSGFQS